MTFVFFDICQWKDFFKDFKLKSLSMDDPFHPAHQDETHLGTSAFNFDHSKHKTNHQTRKMGEIMTYLKIQLDLLLPIGQSP